MLNWISKATVNFFVMGDLFSVFSKMFGMRVFLIVRSDMRIAVSSAESAPV